MEIQRIGRIPRGVKAGPVFHGRAPDGNTALVRRGEANDYAQFDDNKHEHAFGWHPYPLNHFTAIGNEE